MDASGQLPELLFTLALLLAVSAVGFGVLYWVIRLAVRHAMEDVERGRPTQRR